MSDEDHSSDISLSCEAISDSGQLCICLSKVAVKGVESPMSMRIMGTIQGKSTLILVGSGSTHTFITSSLAQQLSGRSSLPKPLSVCVANGEKVAC
jgi:hypothetical protein